MGFMPSSKFRSAFGVLGKFRFAGLQWNHRDTLRRLDIDLLDSPDEASGPTWGLPGSGNDFHFRNLVVLEALGAASEFLLW